jgi:hypothetical protein
MYGKSRNDAHSCILEFRNESPQTVPNLMQKLECLTKQLAALFRKKNNRSETDDYVSHIWQPWLA